jgi:ribonuclease P protein component
VRSGPAVPEGFSRDDRLRKRREFEECYSAGVRVSGRHIQVFVLPEPRGSRPRLGLSAPRRVGNAVQRNRVRRRMREIFRRHRSALPPRPLRIVVNLRASAADAGFAELSQDFLSAVARACSRLPPGR